MKSFRIYLSAQMGEIDKPFTVDLGVGGVRTLTAEPIPPARDYSARLSVAAARGGWMGDASFPK